MAEVTAQWPSLRGVGPYGPEAEMMKMWVVSFLSIEVIFSL